MKSLAGKVAIVTGGSSGIGEAVARTFASAGARLVVAARGAERGEAVAHRIRSEGGDAVFIQADMGRSADIEALVVRSVDRYGRIDVCCNNAASDEGAGRFTADFDEETFDRTVAVNLKGVWLCMKHQIRQMLTQTPGGGAIVNVSSVNGLGGAPGGSLYSATKAGVLALTKSAAQEYAKQGIRVNALVAGAYRTPMLERVMDVAAGQIPEGRAAVEAMYLNHIPLGRIGRPEEAAAVVTWLCSDEASYVTGHSMIADGGMTAFAR